MNVIFFKWGKDVYESHAENIGSLELLESDDERGIYKVRSGNKVYTVHVSYDLIRKEYMASCECGYFRHKKRVCKHIVKILYLSKVEGAVDIPKNIASETAVDELDESDFEEKVVEVMVGSKEEYEDKENKAKRVTQVLQSKIADIADELDTHQIILDLTGSYENLPMIYEFVSKEGKKTVVSWNGYTKAALLQGNIRVEFLGFQKSPSGEVVAVAKAIDLKRNVEVYGVASRLPKTERSTDFAVEILASKAARNAIKKVIDPDILSRVIEYARMKKSVEEVPIREVATP